MLAQNETLSVPVLQHSLESRTNVAGRMISPNYLKHPPEKEKVLVEHSTKHTIVLKPGFYNRRNQSALLKSSFPAGFQIKNKLTDRLGESIVSDGRPIKPYQSFTDWTKGETDTHEDSVSADLTDPYADVAGPYLTEILANRPKLDRPSYDSSKHSSVIATEVELHQRISKKAQNKMKANSPSKPHVFNAPALLPTFTPALSHNKVVNNLVPVSSNAYENWLAAQRSDQAEKFWLIKGNSEEYNYSSHDFAGDVSTTSQLLTQAGSVHSIPPFEEESDSHLERLRTAFPTLMMEVPKPLPPHITIEVHTMNQLVRTDKLCEDKHIVRTIDSQLPLHDLKALITEEIIGGIERAFLIVNAKDASMRNAHRNYNNVDLTFQVFSPQAHTWRSVVTEVDWTQAKLSCRNEHNVLRVMYALEKKSEFLLLKEIQQSFQRARDAERLRETPQISLKALTESMESSLRLKKKYVFTDSPPGSPGHPSTVHRKSKSATPSSARRTQKHPDSSGAKPHNTLAGPPPSYFLPLGQNVAKLAALSSGRSGDGVTSVGTPNGMSRQPSRLLDPLTRASSERDATGGLSGHSTASAQSLLGVRPSPSGNITLADSSTGGSVNPSAGQGSKSIFYPKRSQSLDMLYEQLESSIPRQQDFANTLEQRLLKTRW